MQERTIKLGNLTLRGFAALAPMAGVADRSMRRLCMEHGAAFCVGELASAKGIALKDKKSQEFLTVSADERPMGIQLFGCEPETMALAAISAEKNSPDFIDINMGCPAPKVASNGAGSALMLDEKLAGQIVAAVKKSVKCPVTVKMRSGWDDEHKNAVDLARICQNEGADMITVHGRTKKQGYRPPADLDIIARVKSAVKIPVIGNGDIMSPADAEKMLEYTGCDMVMVGRAANGNPWIFEQINSYLKDGKIISPVPLEKRLETLLRQARFACDEKGEKMAMLQMRKHAAWYLKGIRGAALLRGKCSSLCTFEDLEKMINEITEDLGTYDKDR